MKDLEKKAIDILNKNWKGGFTIPCEGLYPFQWLWDSGFIAIGLAHFNLARAQEELTTLLNAQWDNGFIPHIIFHNQSDSYFPGADYHFSNLHPQASKKYRSSGMTQPPVLGFVLDILYKIAKNKTEILGFIGTVIDKVYANHLYFYQNRDPQNEGLVYIYHNWESGTDNSPVWDDIFNQMQVPEYTFKRRDTSHVDPSQRPSKREYDHYLHLIEIAKAHNYQDKKIAELSPFLVQDPLFNAMLIRSNQALIDLYHLLGKEQDKIRMLQAWKAKSIQSFNSKLFDSSLGAYIHYDLRNNVPIKHITSSSFAPLFANIPSVKRAEVLVGTMMDRFGSDPFYLCASFDPSSSRYNPKKYWRGPVWINLNWMLYYGLKQYDYEILAQRIKKESIELIETFGFYEYFDARKKKSKTAYGGRNFSWTAALLIDMLHGH